MRRSCSVRGIIKCIGVLFVLDLDCLIYRKSTIKPPGFYLFSDAQEGFLIENGNYQRVGLNREGGSIERGLDRALTAAQFFHCKVQRSLS